MCGELDLFFAQTADMPGGGFKGQHSARRKKQEKTAARVMAEAEGVLSYRPPTSVPPGEKGKKKRRMKKSMRWCDPALLSGGGDKTKKKLQTETKLSAVS